MQRGGGRGGRDRGCLDVRVYVRVCLEEMEIAFVAETTDERILVQKICNIKIDIHII